MVMEHPTDPAHYFETQIKRNHLTWVVAATGAVFLNLFLFGLLPRLQDASPPKPAFDTVVSQVNVIRLRPKETPVKRKAKKPPEPEKPKKTPPKVMPQTPKKSVMHVPFELAPRLPVGPDSTALPTLPLESLAANDLGDLFSVDDLDAPLITLARIPPIYPMRAKHRGIEGWVRVQFVVDEDGLVSGVTVLESEPPGIFDQSVIRCVSGWRFRAGTVGSIPVKTRAETTVRFELE